MLAGFLTVIPQTASLVLVTYRPEYEGALMRVHGAQTIALGPLSDPETAALVSELVGPDNASPVHKSLGCSASNRPNTGERGRTAVVVIEEAHLLGHDQLEA